MEVLDLSFFFQCLKEYNDFDVLSYVSFKSLSTIDMRHTQAILAKGRFRSYVFKFSFLNRIVYSWNSLPVAFRTIDQLSLFSKKVNQFYICKFNLNKEKFL